MEKVPTAETFLIINDDKDFRLSMSGIYVSEMMIAFAKVHVEAALKAVYENIEYTEVYSSVFYVVEESILNSYPLSNIK